MLNISIYNVFVCILVSSPLILGQDAVNSMYAMDSDVDDVDYYGFQCLGDEFKCTSEDVCINLEQRCNGIPNECPDNSDEFNCTELATTGAPTTTTSTDEYYVYDECQVHEFDCGGTICISRSSLCDGNEDCPDGNDEAGCPTSTSSPSSSLTYPDYESCSDEQFQCEDGICVPKDSICDGFHDCDNGEDELNCDATTAASTSSPSSSLTYPDYESCSDEQFQCEDGICVPKDSICDGSHDCDNGEDELNCDATTASPTSTSSSSTSYPDDFKNCSKEEFQCEDGLCIPRDALCDDLKDCGDGRDEMNCTDTDGGTESTNITCFHENEYYQPGTLVTASNCEVLFCNITGELVPTHNPDPGCDAAMPKPTITMPLTPTAPTTASNLTEWTVKYMDWRKTLYNVWLPLLNQYIKDMESCFIEKSCSSLEPPQCPDPTCITEFFDCKYCYCSIGNTESNNNLRTLWQRDYDFWQERIIPIWNQVFSIYLKENDLQF